MTTLKKAKCYKIRKIHREQLPISKQWVWVGECIIRGSTVKVASMNRDPGSWWTLGFERKEGSSAKHPLSGYHPPAKSRL